MHSLLNHYTSVCAHAGRANIALPHSLCCFATLVPSSTACNTYGSPVWAKLPQPWSEPVSVPASHQVAVQLSVEALQAERQLNIG